MDSPLEQRAIGVVVSVEVAAAENGGGAEVGFPPGVQILVRDEQWLVRKTVRTRHDGWMVEVTGVSPFVRGTDAVFYQRLDDIRVLDPRQTVLVGDDSPNHRRARMAGRDRRPDHLDRVRDRGVITERSIWVVPADGIDWPHAAQVFLLRREVLDVCQARISRESVFGITSRPAERIDPAGLNTAVRGHWGIENSEHLVRDVTFGEDAHQAYIGATPQVMATLRNLAMSVIRLAGSNEIKRTLQRIRRDRTRALHLIGLN